MGRMLSEPPVVVFGAPHLAALGLTAAIAVGLSLVLRRTSSPRLELGVRIGLAALLITLELLHFRWASVHRGLDVWTFVPLHLCDLSMYLSLFALATKKREAAELLYFWTCSGTLLAMMLPAIESGFPSDRFFIYFGLHGGVIVTAVALIYGMRLSLDRRSWLRAFKLTLIYGVFVAAVDLVAGQNYLFLAHKPAQATLLDYFGPWPVYILVGLALGLGIFFVLGLPFRGREPRAAE